MKADEAKKMHGQSMWFMVEFRISKLRVLGVKLTIAGMASENVLGLWAGQNSTING
jgi:hypothetical protein